VSAGKAIDLPVYFGDAGSPAVLHSVGAERAACAVITLDTPGANYRSVWAMQKHYPSVKTYVRAHDINHGLNLEKAGATVVVPEILEPSMQLAASVLSQFKLPPEEINTHLNNFRKKHLSELQALAALSGEHSSAACSHGLQMPCEREAVASSTSSCTMLQATSFTQGLLLCCQSSAGQLHCPEALFKP
jgi:voltage-gated potassium channel Kch